MNSHEEFDPFEQPPEWFTHIDDTDPQASARPRWHYVAAGIAALVIAVMVSIPALQATLLRQRSASLPPEDFERAAVLFGAAVLQGRSTGQALIFTADGVEQEVVAAVNQVSDLSPPAGRAGLLVRPAACFGVDADAERCYEARLVAQGAQASIVLHYGLSRVDDQPKVVFARVSRQIASAPG